MRQVLLVLVALLIPCIANARPVSYPGGVTLMLRANSDFYSNHLHYSPTKDYSVGLKNEYWREDDFQLHGGQLNFLLKRWNESDSQANLYLKTEAGLALGDTEVSDRTLKPMGSLGIATDWETRRYFLSYENRAIWADSIHQAFHQSGRVGIAPYIGEYGDLHTWLMVEVGHHPESEDEISITPLVRFFKSVYLLEIGANTNGDLMTNFIIRY